MALTLTVTDHWSDTKRIHVIGTLVASGNYSTGGDTLPTNIAIKSTKAPIFVTFNLLSKYLARLNGAKMKLLIPDTGLEVAAGAYPVGVTGDTITFYAIYPKR